MHRITRNARLLAAVVLGAALVPLVAQVGLAPAVSLVAAAAGVLVIGVLSEPFIRAATGAANAAYTIVK